MTVSPRTIALFFSYGVSLKVWAELGMIDREAGIWRRFAQRFPAQYFLTYDKDVFTRAHEYFPHASCLWNSMKLPPFMYSLCVPFIFARQLQRASVYRTNQVSGALPAVLSKYLFHKRLVVRCGFILSQFLKKQNEPWLKQTAARILEKLAYTAADAVIVATADDREYVHSQYRIPVAKIAVIPNGIDVSLFKPMPEIKKQPGRILCVGRLIPQKNFGAAIEALAGIEATELILVGQGPLQNSLEELAKKLNVRVRIINSIANNALAEEYAKAALFLIPSHFEGNPKVLLEAMACGCAVLGAHNKGIDSIITHGTDGYLCAPTVADIRKGIETLFKEPALRESFGRRARETACARFSIDSVATQELELL